MTLDFNESKVSGVWLQIDTSDSNDNCIVKQFKVPEWWLQNQVKEDYESVENFLDEYISDESNDIYCNALLEDMVLLEINSK